MFQKSATTILSLFIMLSVEAQELFSRTEPASNRPAGSLGFRIDNLVMDERTTTKLNYHLVPEVSVGISKWLMVNVNLFFSNRSHVLRSEGGSVYAKYRFFSKDGLQTHFRIAAFGTVSFNNSDIHQEEIELYGHNTGVEIGLVATKLTRKVALSSALSFARARDNGHNNKFVYGFQNSKAVNASVSFGKLMLPKVYSHYGQTNVNLMMELLAQVNTGSGKYYFDMAPSIQFVINSQSRVDIGYRRQLGTNLTRTAPNGMFIRLEHNLFNTF